MYLGRVMEIGDVDQVFDNPIHPYTRALLSAIPVPDPEVEATRERIILEGDLPTPVNAPKGCPFSTRCPIFKLLPEDKQAKCVAEHPEVTNVPGEDHGYACYFPNEEVATTQSHADAAAEIAANNGLADGADNDSAGSVRA